MKLKGLYRLEDPQKIIRFIVGYVHLLTAIAWFGTILYVHILLKPAYAAKGLPKGELILGWMSMIIMSVTGTLHCPAGLGRALHNKVRHIIEPQGPAFSDHDGHSSS